MKKIMFLLVALLLLSSAAPISADNTRTSGLYTYEIKGNGTITITDFDWEKNEADVFIPNMIDGYLVTGIGDGAFAYGDIEKVNNKQETLYAVTLQDGITTIGEKAFWNANLSEINIPSSVQYIGAGAFYGCPSCQFKVAPNHSYFAVIAEGLYDKNKKELLSFSWNNVQIKSNKEGKIITIPEGIQSIGAYAFAKTNVSRVNLPSTLTSIGDYAFYNVGSLLKGDLSHVKEIGSSAFEGGSISGNLILPNVETIGENAFQYTNIRSGIDFTGSPLKRIGENAFYNIRGGKLCIETEKCSDIGRGNSGLGEVMTEESDFSPLLTTIPAGLNPHVTSLPPTVTAIESGAFTEAVSDFHLSASLNNIATDAFPKGSTFIVDAGSYAELWCSENGFGYSIEGQNSLDWLNN